ncbi:MAG: type II secretion system protein M [Pseudomonadota bacterium]|nr:MAG: type II secretion system protein M [Pseudomonadota bacterium]
MMDWWQQREPRQRLLLMLAAGIALCAITYVWLWEPLAEARQSQRARVAEQQALINWLDAVAPVAERLRAGRAGAPRSSDRSLLGLTDETARAAGLAGAMARIEPAGEDRVRVWLEGAEFVAVMSWLEAFSRAHPVRVARLQVDRGQQAGRVDVRVTVVSDA